MLQLVFFFCVIVPNPPVPHKINDQQGETKERTVFKHPYLGLKVKQELNILFLAVYIKAEEKKE